MFRYGDAQSSFMDYKQDAWLFICLSSLEISLNSSLLSFLQTGKFYPSVMWTHRLFNSFSCSVGFSLACAWQNMHFSSHFYHFHFVP